MNKHHIIISQHGVSSLKYTGEFFSKSNFFMGEIKPFWVNLWGEGGSFYMGGIMPDSCQVESRASFIKIFSSNQNHVNLKIFPNHGWIFT